MLIIGYLLEMVKIEENFIFLYSLVDITYYIYVFKIELLSLLYFYDWKQGLLFGVREQLKLGLFFLGYQRLGIRGIFVFEDFFGDFKIIF